LAPPRKMWILHLLILTPCFLSATLDKYYCNTKMVWSKTFLQFTPSIIYLFKKILKK
jgi:hypothetical protein